MSRLFFLLAMLVILPGFSARAEEPSIVGHWQFYKKVFQGQDFPEGPAATLRLHFEFSAEGESHLYWWHTDTPGRCERKGRYSVQDGKLIDEITWVNPENARDCSEDQDMQLGRKTSTAIFFRDGDLAIRFHLNGEPLDMVWKRFTEEN